MLLHKNLKRLIPKSSLALVTLLTAGSLSAQQQLGIPSSNGRQWRILPASSDEFQDNQLGWQWKNTAPNYFLYERSDNPQRGGVTWSKFRPDNIAFQNGQLVVKNLKYNNPIQTGGAYSQRFQSSVPSYTYSGGWMESKAGWLVEGQFQIQSRVDRVFPDIWPTFWLNYSQGGAGGHELDIFQYQLNILDQTHFTWKPNNAGQDRKSARVWNPYGPNRTPVWEHNWAMDRVKSWSYWGCRTTRNTNPTFYINGKQEHRSSIGGANSGMSMIFSSSPNIFWRPLTSDIPWFRVAWVRTHIP